MEHTGQLLNNYLKRFKVFNPSSLFTPDGWDIKYWVSQSRCPLCQRKLYWNLNRTKAFCKSKYRDKFFITKKAFDLLTNVC